MTKNKPSHHQGPKINFTLMNFSFRSQTFEIFLNLLYFSLFSFFPRNKGKYMILKSMKSKSKHLYLKLIKASGCTSWKFNNISYLLLMFTLFLIQSFSGAPFSFPLILSLEIQYSIDWQIFIFHSEYSWNPFLTFVLNWLGWSAVVAFCDSESLSIYRDFIHWKFESFDNSF